MAVLSIILLVLFVIVSLALIFIVAIQSEDNGGLGGIFGGNGDSAFGGKTNKVINKITAWLLAIFVVLAVLTAVVNNNASDSILSRAEQNVSSVENGAN